MRHSLLLLHHSRLSTCRAITTRIDSNATPNLATRDVRRVLPGSSAEDRHWLPRPRTAFRSPRRNPTTRMSKPPSSATAASRLDLLSRQLQLQLQRPLSTARNTRTNTLGTTTSARHLHTPASANMSKQEKHPAVLIPGPIEYDDRVLEAMSHYRYYKTSTVHTLSLLTACPAQPIPRWRTLCQDLW